MIAIITALKEICDIRAGVPKINKNNLNRYCILADSGQTTTAYCFSVPIYNESTRSLVRREFIQDGNAIRFLGSNVKGCFHRGMLVLSNQNGGASITLPTSKILFEEEKLTLGDWTARPSFNGLHVHSTSNIVKFKIHVDRNFSLRHCSKSFGIMQEPFHPFLTVTPLFATTPNGLTLPVAVNYEQEEDRGYTISMKTEAGNAIDFEINLYEPKLFQDTTVESLHPKENNAYGGISFLGTTKQTGTQWLYLRLDTTKLPDLDSVTIKKILFHIPRWNDAVEEVLVSVPQKRFCSFGSNWENKIGHTSQITKLFPQGKYLTIDATKMFTDISGKYLLQTEGLILKTKNKTDLPMVISTGDNYTLPQILEVQYES